MNNLSRKRKRHIYDINYNNYNNYRKRKFEEYIDIDINNNIINKFQKIEIIEENNNRKRKYIDILDIDILDIDITYINELQIKKQKINKTYNCTLHDDTKEICLIYNCLGNINIIENNVYNYIK
jgi:hypothetical protein